MATNETGVSRGTKRKGDTTDPATPPKTKRQKMLDSLLRVGTIWKKTKYDNISQWKDYLPFVEANMEAFQAVSHLTRKMLKEIDEQKTKTEIEKEEQKYAGETKEQRSNRARDYKEWIEIDPGDMPDLSDLDYVHLCRKDDCWYRGNLDRMEECRISRLAGTKTVFLCDVCMANFLDEFADILEHWDDDLNASIF